MGRDANILYENYVFVLDPLLHTVLRFSQLHSYLNTKNVQNPPKFPYRYPPKQWNPQLVSFYTPWKHQKTSGCLMLSGYIERDQDMRWVNCMERDQ